MKIFKEEYEIVGYVKKKYICEHCNQEMLRVNEQVELLSSPPKYEIYCPKCGRTELVDANLFNSGSLQVRRKK